MRNLPTIGTHAPSTTVAELAISRPNLGPSPMPSDDSFRLRPAHQLAIINHSPLSPSPYSRRVPAEDDTLSAMAVRSLSSNFDLQLRQQTAGPARSAGWFIWLSAAVLFTTDGRCLSALHNLRARRDLQAPGQLPAHCQPLLHNSHLY